MKKNNFKKFCLLVGLIITNSIADVYAQETKYFSISQKPATHNRLSIGDHVPLALFEKIPKKTYTELIILDFWSTGCSSCLESFPKMEQLQKKFNEKLQIVLVNSWETDAKIKDRLTIMNAGRAKNNLAPILLPQLPSITGDTVYKKMFPAVQIPHHVWLNKSGEVMAITSGYNATEKHIQQMLGGKKLNMMVKDDITGKGLSEKGFIQPTSADLPAIYYSAFVPYFNTGWSFSQRTDSIKGTYRISRYNTGVIEHFTQAFLNPKQNGNRVLIELRDKGKYLEPADKNLLDEYKLNYLFSYELQGLLKDRNNWQEKMKLDVNAFFGSKFGITGVLEKRMFNCWILIKRKDGLLTTSGKKSDSFSNNNLQSWSNVPFKNVLPSFYEVEDMEAMRPFVDESGIDPMLLVDMQLAGNLKDVQNLRKQLHKYGLDIVEGRRELEVLVIKDIL